MQVIAFQFFIFTMVTWRITHLLSKEDGPFDIVFSLRKKAGAGFFGSLLDCFYCTSIWIALPFGIWLGDLWFNMIIYWWALSGAACLLEQATTKRCQSKNTENGKENMPQFKED